MLQAEVYLNILENLTHNDLDTLLVTNRQLGTLSRRVSVHLPRHVGLNHFHPGQFNLRFDVTTRVAAFDDLPSYLQGSQLTDISLDASRLDPATLQALALCKSYFHDDARLSMGSMRGRTEQSLIDVFTTTLITAHMRLHVSVDPLETDLFAWPGVLRCSDLRVTLTMDYMHPESALEWLLADKCSAGPLRLRVQIHAREVWYAGWEASAQRLLLDLCASERRFPDFDCQFAYMGARGQVRLVSDFQLNNTTTGQKFDVKQRTRSAHTGYLEHTICISSV